MPIKWCIILLMLLTQAEAVIVQKIFGSKFRGRFLGGELGVDVYEPYVSLLADLRKRYTIKEIEENEFELYKLMLSNAFIPGYFSVVVEYILQSGRAPMPDTSFSCHFLTPKIHNIRLKAI